MNKERFKEWMELDENTLGRLMHHVEKKCPKTNDCELKGNEGLVLNCCIFQHKIMQLIGKKHDPR